MIYNEKEEKLASLSEEDQESERRLVELEDIGQQMIRKKKKPFLLKML